MTHPDQLFRSRFSAQFGPTAVQRELDAAVAALTAPAPLGKSRSPEVLLKNAASDLAKMSRAASAIDRALAEIHQGLALRRAVELERESATIN